MGRFIPACAGNTFSNTRLRQTSSVHPRVRGEHCSLDFRRDSKAGSSPRARGTLHYRSLFSSIYRFIPACAGNTRVKRWRRGLELVHPRVRGEHAFVCRCVVGSSGSSPRARGTPDCAGLVVSQCRFIPACAGNTAPFLRRRPHGPVHPRVRGEHSEVDAIALHAFGSSPRARGTRNRHHGCQ